MTVAEISVAAGHHPPVGVNDTARDVEIKHEAEFLSHDLCKYESERLGIDFESDNAEGIHAWSFILRNEVLVEDAYFDHADLHKVTRMGLARLIQRNTGCSDAQRNEYSRMVRAALFAMLGAPAPLVAPAAPVVPAAAALGPAGRGGAARGRGRGPVAGRGKAGGGKGKAARGGGRRGGGGRGM